MKKALIWINKNIKNFYIDIKFYKYYINIYKKKKENINYYFNFIKIIYYIYYWKINIHTRIYIVLYIYC